MFNSFLQDPFFVVMSAANDDVSMLYPPNDLELATFDNKMKRSARSVDTAATLTPFSVSNKGNINF